ncbi:MAG: hypothetical protein HQ516_04910 [Chlorobium sp.]|nr:hypothetical protein [Chlorobium phaeovibrioides]NQU46371.1 hypothetical protein [Chlorobium sp.]
MRKILFLAPNYPPAMTDGSSRAFRMASSLPAYGWEPMVIAPPAFVSSGESAGSDAPGEEASGVKGERIWRTGPPVAVEELEACGVAALAYGGSMPPKGTLGKVLPSRFSAPGLCAIWEKHAGALAENVMNRFGDIEAIFVQGPSACALEIALELSVRHGVPVLFDLQAPLTRPSSFAPSGSLHSGDGSSLEEKLLTSGYSLITPTRALKEYFLTRYFGRVTHDDITIIADTPSVPANDSRIPGEGIPDSSGRPVFLLQRLTEKETSDFFRSLSSSMGAAGGCCSGAVAVTHNASEKMLKKFGLAGSVELVCPFSEGDLLELCRKASFVLFASGRQDSGSLRVPELLVDIAGMGVAWVAVAPDEVILRFASEAGGLAVPAGDGATLAARLTEIAGAGGGMFREGIEDLSQQEKVMEALVREIALTLPV